MAPMEAQTSLGTRRELLLDLLLQAKKLTEKDLEPVYELQRKDELTLEQALVRARAVSDRDIAEAYASHFHVPLASLDGAVIEPDEEVLDLLPEKFLRDSLLVPMRREGTVLHVACVDPSNLETLQEVQLHTGLTPVVHVVPLGQIEKTLESLFGARNLVSEISQEVPADEEVEEEETPLNDEVLELDKPIVGGDDTQIIRLVNHIIRQAIEEGTSDIHIEPQAERLSIRYRIDGCLQARPAPPKKMFLPLISRLKVISKMDIAEKRLPQDGAFSVMYKGNQIDMRVSTVPTVHGEKMVIRILNKDALPLDLEKLGFGPKQRERFYTAARSPHGLIFVTGPTGSGKSTTLYATLKLLNTPDKNLVTVEDPVEYKMDGVNQVQTHAEIGMTFAATLRSFLRQDPDVIMVGEVRDQETAQICLRAALTGHLVLSTLHTNSALAAVDRLVDMGIEPFMVASTLRLVEAQRLIRRLCEKCKEPYQPDAEAAEKYGLDPNEPIYRAVGCDACNGIGYKGRVGVFEVIQITPTLRDMIQHKASLSELQEAAEREGMSSLMTNAIEKVRLGITSLDEAVKSIAEGGE